MVWSVELSNSLQYFGGFGGGAWGTNIIKPLDWSHRRKDASSVISVVIDVTSPLAIVVLATDLLKVYIRL